MQKKKALYLLDEGIHKTIVADMVACSTKTLSRWEAQRKEAQKPIKETLQLLVEEINILSKISPVDSFKIKELSYSINVLLSLKIEI